MAKPFLSEEQWRRIAPLLPKLRSRGRPWADNLRVLEGILWVIKTGARWRDLPSNIPAPRPAGVASSNGKKGGCGDSSYRNWIGAAGWIGVSRLATMCPVKSNKLMTRPGGGMDVGRRSVPSPLPFRKILSSSSGYF